MPVVPVVLLLYTLHYYATTALRLLHLGFIFHLYGEARKEVKKGQKEKWRLMSHAGEDGQFSRFPHVTDAIAVHLAMCIAGLRCTW